MSGESGPTVANAAEPDRPTRRVAGLAVDRQTVAVTAGGVALLVTALWVAVRIAWNLPFDPVTLPESSRLALDGLGAVIPALALVAVSIVSDRLLVRVGLLFAGVFGLLGAVAPAATLPAAVAIVGGGGLAILGALGRPTEPWSARRSLVAGLFVLGVASSLAGSLGLVAQGRAFGTLFVLVALAALGIRARGDRIALGAGALAFLASVAVITVKPFAAGSALLVAFAIVGVPHLLVSVAVAGATAAAVAGYRRGAYGLPIGAGLLLVAGMPVTFPRAAAVLLGVALALVGAEALTTDRATTEVYG
jgi:hypothetical protein